MKHLSNYLMVDHLDELVTFEPNGFPFVSLYLNAQADRHRCDNFEPFVRKEIESRAKAFADGSPELEGFERAAGRIVRYLNENLDPLATGLAIFSRAGGEEYFKAIQIDAPIHKNRLHVSCRPHIDPLVRLVVQNADYVAVTVDP